MKDLTRGSPTRHIIAFSAPLLIGNIFQQLYGTVNAIIVGRYVDGKALAAVASAGSVMHFLIAVLVGLSGGAAVLVAQFYGAHDEAKLRLSVSTSVITLAAAGGAISVLSVILMPNFMDAMGVPADIFDDAVLYMRIIMCGLISLIAYNLFTAYLRALGDTKRPLYILFLSTVLNIALDLLFVLRFKLGVAGVAIATLISQTVAASACYLYVCKAVPLLRIQKLLFDKEVFSLFLRYSLPAALQYSMTSFANLTIMRLVNSFGSTTVAGYAAALKIDEFALMPLSSLSMAVSTFAAQNMGADREQRAKRGLYSGIALAVGIGLLVSSSVLLFRTGLISMFVDKSASIAGSIVSIGSNYLSILAFFYVIYGIFFAFNGFFRGVGDPVIVMLLTTVSMSVRSISSHLLVRRFGFGVEAIAWSIPIGWGLCTMYGVYHFYTRRWAGKSVIRLGSKDV